MGCTALASAAETKKRRVRKRVRVARKEIRAIVDGGTVYYTKRVWVSCRRFKSLCSLYRPSAFGDVF
jgi:hypothetical protein